VPGALVHHLVRIGRALGAHWGRISRAAGALKGRIPVSRAGGVLAIAVCRPAVWAATCQPQSMQDSTAILLAQDCGNQKDGTAIWREAAAPHTQNAERTAAHPKPQTHQPQHPKPPPSKSPNPAAPPPPPPPPPARSSPMRGASSPPVS